MAEATRDVTDWLKLARTGSRDALGRVLEDCRGYLLLTAEKQLGADLRAKGSASDLVQETFLEAQRDFARFHGRSEEELLAWLRTLLFNNLSNFARRYRKTTMRELAREVPLQANAGQSPVTTAIAAADPTPSGSAQLRELADLLRQALARMPEDYRQVVTFRYLEERTFDEIGELMNRSPDAARKLWARAMERLRQEWEGTV